MARCGMKTTSRRRRVRESEEMADQKDKIIGGFRVLQEIQAGSGSQGTVYKAVCEDAKHNLVAVGTVVALKVMPVQDEGGAQWRKLQKRTAELSRLDHPNVVKYYGCFSEQGLFNDVHVVVQEFLQGETLKDKLARQKTGLDADEALRVVDSALAGLEYTAGCGLVHRDVKPGNIFVCDDGGVKLIDFEIAKQEGGTATASVGNIRGSFDYMAPDFTNPEFRGDVQSDVFSMGVVLHETLTGKTPYERLEGDDKQANFAFLSRWSQTVSEGRNPIHVSSRIKRLLAHADEVVARSLAPEREKRYRDFTQFREGLKLVRFRSLKNEGTSYQLLQFIGKGGFGEVFKARNRATGQLVAVKHLLKSAYAARFHREAKIMRKLQDPCFVQLVDFFVVEVGGGQEAFLVMAFLDGMPGSSLRDAIKRRAEVPMAWRDVFIAFTRYARGLLAMHKQGIFHRDIKPSNLYYPAERPKAAAIMDLGIARDVSGTATTGQVPGTLDYMPPEVVVSDSRGDGGMDIYALGLCLYEALTGKTAFPRLPTGTTAYAAFFERAKSKLCPSFAAPEVQSDAEVLSLLTDMTNPDASRRLKNAGVLLMRLESIVDSRFGGEGNESETVAATVDMPDEDASTVATSAMEGSAAAAIERERLRIEEERHPKRPGPKIIGLVAVLIVVAGAGVLAYLYRESVGDWLAHVKRPYSVAVQPSMPAEEDPAAMARREREDAAQREAQIRLEEQQAAIKKQQAEMEKRSKELEEQQKRLEEERKAKEEADRKAREEADRIAADKTKTEAERAAAREAAATKAAEEKAKRDAEQKEMQRRLEEQQAAIKKQQAEMEKQRKELEEQQKAMKARQEAAAKAAEEARKAKEEEARKAAEKAANDAAARAAEEARKKAEAEMAAKLAEMQRQLEEANRKAEEEKRLAEESRKKAEAEAARLAAEKRAAEERVAKEREESEKRRKAAEERAARERAERETEAKRLEEERQKVLEAQRKQQEEADRIAKEKAEAEKTKKEAEEKARKLEEEQRRAEEAKKKREDTARDLVSKAGFYYESEDYYEAVKYYREAVRSGYSMGSGEMQEFEDAYKRANEKIRSLKSRCEDMIRLGQTPLRKIEDLDAESKNLVDWYFEVKKR